MAMSTKQGICITVNGVRHEREVEPRLTLADFLRHELALGGTHVGCEHGVCGACTVLVDGAPIRACLMFGIQGTGKTIETVEGLKDGSKFHLLQKKFMEHQALQCGFCTPGFLMLGLAILERHPPPDDAELVELVSSSLCRCTGYGGIVAALKAALDEKCAAP